MKKRLLTALALVLAFLMMGSAFATIITLVVGAEDKTFNTTTPSHLYDFSTDALYTTFANTSNLEVSLGDGFTTFKATGDDPYTWISGPTCTVPEATYVAIRYRTTAKRSGELFCTRSDNDNIVANNHQWKWNASGEWETIVVSITPWQNAKEGATFNIFRIDPLQANVRAGESIDIQYYAFFSNEADAKGFNFDEYKAKLAYEEEQKRQEEEAAREVNWPDPTYTEQETVADDTNAGTLKYTASEDGATVTISYEVNGETLSYTVPNNDNYLFGGYAATDDLGRSLYDSTAVGSYGTPEQERYIGLFYFLCMGEHGQHDKVVDLQKVLDQYGPESGAVKNDELYPEDANYWWGEPLYGYYYSNDTWVMRKHAELLTMADVDFLYIDVTNAFTYIHNAVALMEILHELSEQGFDAPQVVFYTNANSEGVIRQLYDSIYGPGLYPDTWFRINGKPVIIGPTNFDMDGFFTVKRSQWPTEGAVDNAWPWMDFGWPQRVYKNRNGDGSAISVSVAQHSGTVVFSDSSLYGDYTNRGRSYNNPTNISHRWSTIKDDYRQTLQSSYDAWLADQTLTMQGLNFQKQFDNAVESDATYVLVTGWNEWSVGNNAAAHNFRLPYFFTDCASMEFSRDAEMMRGGYFDNYYIQMTYNIQRLKGTAPIIVQDSRKPINVTGEFDQWNDVTVTYTDPENDVQDRNALGGGDVTYTNTSGRNDIVASKVTSDSKNLYFYVSTVYDISMFDTDSSWMQLYLNVDGRDAETGETGWYGYDFIINHKAKSEFTTTVAKYNGTDGAFSFETVGEVSYRAKDNEMMIAVPLSLLGIEGYKEIDIEFKWADSETVYDEMEDFYCGGDVAPLGRLNYVYQNYIPGVSQITYPEPETQPETEAPTDPETEAPTQPDTDAPATEAPTDGETEEGKKGCGGVIAAPALALIVSLLSAALVARRKDD